VTDAELVERTLGGAEDSFRVLVVRHQQRVYNLLARMLRHPALAEELAQETFLKAFSHLRSFDPRFKFSNWLFRIAHNTAIDAIRRRPALEVSFDDPGEGQQAPGVDGFIDPDSDSASRAVERRELAAILGEALARLRPEYREAVVLRYQEDLSYEEIGAITGVPLGTVKSNLHRARAEMAAFLRRRGLGPVPGGPATPNRGPA
jgi:RNA polymerase sigma-70 factor, ECF subfamily